jgi:tryptophanyl-tRNA synthetase
MLDAYGRADFHEDCEAGRIGCLECKMRLANFLNERLAPIRERRKELEQNPALLDEILASGAEKARKAARETMEEVRRAMRFG